MVRFVETFGVLSEKYSSDNAALLRYMKEKPIDPYAFWHMFPDWYDNNYDGDIEALIEKSGLASYGVDVDNFLEQPEYFYDLPEEIRSHFESDIKEEFMHDMMRDDPTEVPTWGHMSLNRDKLIERLTWLIHFSDEAPSIARGGFQYGVDQMDRLGLTKWMGEYQKEHGGYNFAFKADSRYAFHAASGHRGQAKYGRHAVMFQNSGVIAYHFGDEEDQVIFHGSDVDPRDIILLMEVYGDWIVMPHPTKASRYPGQLSKEEGVFRGDFEKVVKWVMQNHRQYARVITGW